MIEQGGPTGITHTISTDRPKMMVFKGEHATQVSHSILLSDLYQSRVGKTADDELFVMSISEHNGLTVMCLHCRPLLPAEVADIDHMLAQTFPPSMPKVFPENLLFTSLPVRLHFNRLAPFKTRANFIRGCLCLGSV